MTLDEIKAAVDNGDVVYWSSKGYRVIKDSIGQYLIKCTINNTFVGLTRADDKTLNGNEDQFFIGEQ